MKLTDVYLCTCIVVTVSISDGSQHILTNESSGFVWICVEADHDPRASFSVTLTTEDVTAEGKQQHIIYSLHSYSD